MSKSVLVLLSGGLDSAILAQHYLNKNYDVQGLFINYGQTWTHEFSYATQISQDLKIPLQIVSASVLTVAEDYFVPIRNMFLLSIAVSRAYSQKLDYVAIGANRCEYSDQKAEFIDRFNFTLEYCLNKPIWVLAPFCSWTKEKIFKYAIKLKFPIEKTCPCIKTPPCGECLSCKLRKKYGVKDVL